MRYIPAFVFGDPKYHLALLPSGIFRRDTFESISRDPTADKIMRRQEQMMLEPPVSEIDEYRAVVKDELDKVIARVNDIYSKGEG